MRMENLTELCLDVLHGKGMKSTGPAFRLYIYQKATFQVFG